MLACRMVKPFWEGDCSQSGRWRGDRGGTVWW